MRGGKRKNEEKVTSDFLLAIKCSFLNEKRSEALPLLSIYRDRTRRKKRSRRKRKRKKKASRSLHLPFFSALFPTQTAAKVRSVLSLDIRVVRERRTEGFSRRGEREEKKSRKRRGEDGGLKSPDQKAKRGQEDFGV